MTASPLTRRDFFGRAAGAAILAAVGTRLSSAATGMFVSLNGATTRGVAGVDRPRLAAKLGFGGVDWDLGPFKTLGLDASKALFAELKIKPSITNLPLTAPFGGDEDAFKAKLPQLAEDAAFAASIGCPKMMAVLPATAPLPKSEYRKLVRDRLAAISDVLLKSNIRLGVEFLGPLYMRSGGPSPCPARGPIPAPPAGAGGRVGGAPRIPFIWTLPETVELAKDSGANIGAVLDAWHWHHSGGTAADIVAAGGSRIIHVHVSDAKAQPPEEVCDSQRLMPGEGVIDLVGFFQALQKIGYDDSVSPEPLGRVPMEMSAEDASRLALDTTTAVMKKAGLVFL